MRVTAWQESIPAIAALTSQVTEQPVAEQLLSDDFSIDRRAGTVIGSQSNSGLPRLGVDREGIISIDHGALRIRPLIQPGWGRAALAYGPFERQNGLAFAVFMLNGHNTSQAERLPDTLVRRLWRWARGSETHGIAQRLLRWLAVGNKVNMVRQLAAWAFAAREGASVLDENLLIGWLPSPLSTAPRQTGSAFTMHAGGPTNGNLWLKNGRQQESVLGSLQNVPLYYIIILREEGAAYYAASLTGTRELPTYPQLRPLAIDAQGTEQTLYATIQQSVLGQIGFRVDTRIYGVRVQKVPTLGKWFGTAHTAESGIGTGALATTKTELGATWSVPQGQFDRTTFGLHGVEAENLALLRSAVPTGLIHLLIDGMAEATTDPKAQLAVMWRYRDANNYWFCQISAEGAEIGLRYHGEHQILGTAKEYTIARESANALQIADDGATVRITLDGMSIFANTIVDSRLTAATGLGIRIAHGKALYIRNWEAHPRVIPMPSCLQMGAPWAQSGETTLVADTFQRDAGPLADTQTEVGHARWERTIGGAAMALTGDGAVRVQASVECPVQDRTAYTVRWRQPNLADLTVDILPPGSGRNLGEKGRGGLIFWQDSANYLIINTWLDDHYAGASLSSFFHLNGFEELYDAVWTNVGERVTWGQEYRLRVIFDGMHYLAYINDEPVLYRALTDIYPTQRRLAIRRVGIVVNWEWGHDTGSQFRNFIAKG